MPNQFTRMAKNFLEIESDMSYRIPKNASLNDYSIYVFEQLWGSSALGFGGVGGQAMTSAYTFVFVPKSIESNCFVYFGGGFAYAVPYSEVFIEDLFHQNMEPVSMKGKYIKAAKNDV